jgi:hypothetical protein
VTAWQRRAFNVLSVAVTVTGVLYFWMKYMMVADDPLAVINHPLQPYMIDAHLVSGPALLVMFGIVFSGHIASKLGQRVPLRRSGIVTLATFLTMASTGYLLPEIVSEQLRLVLLWLHIGSGLVFATSYGIHLVAGLRLWRRPIQTPRSVSA